MVNIKYTPSLRQRQFCLKMWINKSKIISDVIFIDRDLKFMNIESAAPGIRFFKMRIMFSK